MNFVWVAVGGAFGSCLRYALSIALGPLSVSHGFPWATFAANLLGSFALGVAFVLAEDRTWLGTDVRLFLGTGLLGGFTTYSTFNLESLSLMRDADWGRAALYIGGTLLLCLAAGALGLILGRAVRPLAG